VLAALIEDLLDQAHRIGRSEPQPAVPAMMTILFESELGALAERTPDLEPLGSQPEDPGRAGASI
jgi:hypothetical protein